jgi:dihydroxyacetone kinase
MKKSVNVTRVINVETKGRKMTDVKRGARLITLSKRKDGTILHGAPSSSRSALKSSGTIITKFIPLGE